MALCAAFPSFAAAQTGSKLTGVLYYGADLMPDFSVSLYSPDSIIGTRTDKDGKFEFDNLAPGTYDLQAKEVGAEADVYGIRVGDKDVGPLTVTASYRWFYALSSDCGRRFWADYKPDQTNGGHLNGTLTLVAENALPDAMAKEARIDLVSQTGPSHHFSLHPDNGKFDFQNVPPGRYRLVAHAGGYWKTESTVWIAKTATTGVKIILRKHGHPAICE